MVLLFWNVLGTFNASAVLSSSAMACSQTIQGAERPSSSCGDCAAYLDSLKRLNMGSNDEQTRPAQLVIPFRCSVNDFDRKFLSVLRIVFPGALQELTIGKYAEDCM